ncbi:hypothetical protein I5F71_02880 [Pseudomonas aeruginosa]|nr:hypothetical protein [Pseudomonas aeruginosa]MBG4718192.1 hypothetical protein [Pseudomonas aeruginosa]
MSKPPAQRLVVPGINAAGMMGEGAPVAPTPVDDDLVRTRNRMRARLAAMPDTKVQRTGATTLRVEGEVTVTQLEALLFLMTDSEEWMP